MTTESCPECGGRKWAICRLGTRIEVSCSDCDEVQFLAEILHPRTHQLLKDI